jgi:hypothetical protein
MAEKWICTVAARVFLGRLFLFFWEAWKFSVYILSGCANCSGCKAVFKTDGMGDG